MLQKAGRWIVRILLLHKLFELLASTWPTSLVFPRVEKICRWWKTMPAFWRHVSINIMVGLLIAVGLHLFHDTKWLRDAEEAGIDWMIRMNSGIVEQSKVNYALLDIDERTYRYWGEPFYTPREDLLKIIQYAVSAHPRLVFVDIEVAIAGHLPEEDLAFQRFISDYPSDAPPLILVRTFRQSLEDQNKLEQRASFLDRTVEDNPNVFWASTLFIRDSDHRIRYWQLWTAAEDLQQDLVPVPSVQLLATALIQSSTAAPQLVHQDIIDRLRPYAAGSAPVHGTLDLPGLTLNLDPTPLQQRIIYSYPADFSALAAVSQKIVEPSLIRRSVLPVVARTQDVDNTWLNKRVVVIGTSYPDSRDIHATPLGEMPGSLILVNAIHSLLEYREISPPPALIKILLEVMLIVIMSFAFTLLSSFWGMLLSGAVVVAVLLPLSFLFFKQGVWLDFALPLVGVQLHEMAAKFEENLNEYRTRRSHD